MGFKQVVEQLDPATMRSGETQEDDATDELAVTSRTKGELDSWKALGVRPSSWTQSRVHPVSSRGINADHNIIIQLIFPGRSSCNRNESIQLVTAN